MDNQKKNIMIIAGEVSGDLLGAALIKELLKIDPSLKIAAIGGDKMKENGGELIYHLNKMAFLGFTEVIKHIPFIKQVQRDLLKVIEEREINNVILIDYPGFNLNFARKLRKRGINIIYYISPQIWAWGFGRMKKIKRLVNKMIVIFPFEEEMYKKAGVDVEFVGHPLIERVEEHNFITREELCRKYNLNPAKEILLLLPGSRNHEVELILPSVADAAVRIAEEFNMEIAVAASANIDQNLFEGYNKKYNLKVINGNTFDLMKHAKLGIIKSGTSTLEAALFELPMVVVYKTSRLTYMIGKKLIKLKNIAMANIIAGSEIVPELIQDHVNSDELYKSLKRYLTDIEYYNNTTKKLGSIKAKLGTAGASKRAAKIIYSFLNGI
jgi:lipid-A-disaccharide synthase